MQWPVRARAFTAAMTVLVLHAMALFFLTAGDKNQNTPAERPLHFAMLKTEPSGATTESATSSAIKPGNSTPPVARRLSADLPRRPSAVPTAPTMWVPEPPPTSSAAVAIHTPVPDLTVDPAKLQSVQVPETVTEDPPIELPLSTATHLLNPKPTYPSLSRRLQEQGQVIHSVLIGLDGRPLNAQLVKSSGFDRLDRAAQDAVMRWRYVPGKRGGTPAVMRVDVPITWVLE